MEKFTAWRVAEAQVGRDRLMHKLAASGLAPRCSIAASTR